MPLVRGEIEAFILFYRVDPIIQADLELSQKDKAELLALVEGLFIHLPSGLQGQKDRVHLPVLCAGDQEFDADLFVIGGLDPCVLAENNVLVRLLAEKLLHAGSENVQYILQRGYGG